MAIGAEAFRRALPVVAALLAVQALRAQGQGHFADFQAMIEQSAPIENLLSNAEEGIRRSDWKYAIDSLQRIIDDPQNVLLERADGRYESARWQAQRKMASMPFEGLQAYRVLNDGRARGMLDRAAADHDVEGLRQVVDRYLLTRSGDDAAALLASWLLDAGRAGEALALLQKIHLYCPDSDVPAEVIGARTSAAYAMLGASDKARNAAEGVGADLREGLIGLAQGYALERAGSGEGFPADIERWAYMGGGLDRTGVMPVVQPSLAPDLPWRWTIAGAEADAWTGYLDEHDEDALPPVQHALVADGRLFVKGLGPVLALDLESFEPLWESRAVVETLTDRLQRRRLEVIRRMVREEVLTEDAPSDQVRDYVRSSLSVVGNQLLSVESKDSGLNFEEDGVVILPMRPGTEPREGNRLVAYDVTSGEQRWRLGQSDRADDEFRRAYFLSAPVGAADRLWVPAQIGADLYMVVLDPADGTVLDRIVLCTPIRGQISRQSTLSPAVGEGLLFVPTGQGLLFALQVTDGAPIWATRYPSSESADFEFQRNDYRHWVSTPPVVAGSMVVLAPTDSDSLMAFDTQSGELLWSADRQRCRYIVAVRGNRIWIAGDDVRCLSLADGSELWRSERYPTTGRVILAGDRLMVPTVEGISMIGADDGHGLEALSMPPGHEAPGNLLSLGHALISVDMVEVRKFPDLNESYARTLAAHEADADDPRIAIRLAWMEWMRGDPALALVALERVVEYNAKVDAEQLGQAAHLRVEALLSLSKGEGVSAEEAIAYLERARREAEGTRAPAEDRLRISLALGDRLDGAGRRAEAYRQWWELGLSALGDLEYRDEAGIIRLARRIISERLFDLGGRISGEELAELTREAEAMVRRTVNGLHQAEQNATARQALRVIGQTGAPGGWDQAALIALATWEMERGWYEAAEHDYASAVQLERDASRTAEALLGLAKLNLRGDQNLPATAARNLDRLEREYTDTVIPAAEPKADAAAGDVRGPAEAVVSQVNALRQRLDQEVAAAHEEALNPRAFRLQQERAWPIQLVEGHPRFLNVRGARCEALAERLLVLTSDNILRAHRVCDGGMEWEAELRLPSQFSLQQDILEVGTDHNALRYEAVVDGQTVLVATSDALHAVGIVTGRRLWSLPRTPPPSDVRAHEITFFDAANRMVAAVLRPGWLSVHSLRDGSVQWEQRLDLVQASHVRIHDGMVQVANPEWTEVHVFDLLEGRKLSTLRFRQDDALDTLIEPKYLRGVLCGPDGSAVLAYDVLNGDERWRLPVPDQLMNIFAVDGDTLGVGGLGGKLRLVEVASGEVAFEEELVPCRNGVVDARMNDGVLVVAGRVNANGMTPVLIGVDRATGSVSWERSDIAPAYRPWNLDAAEGVVPATILLAAEGARQRSNQRLQNMAVAAIDVVTGQNSGAIVFAVDGPAEERLTGDMQVWPGCFVVGTTNEVKAIRTAPGRSGAAQ